MTLGRTFLNAPPSRNSTVWSSDSLSVTSTLVTAPLVPSKIPTAGGPKGKGSKGRAPAPREWFVGNYTNIQEHDQGKDGNGHEHRLQGKEGGIVGSASDSRLWYYQNRD